MYSSVVTPPVEEWLPACMYIFICFLLYMVMWKNRAVFMIDGERVIGKSVIFVISCCMILYRGNG